MSKIKLSKIKLLVLLSLVFIAGGLVYYLNYASAFTGNTGVVMYGSGTTNATRGRTNERNYTYGNPGTVNAGSSATQRTNSNIQYVIEKTAPTRIEKIVGQQKADGRLDIETCSGNCSAAGNFTAQWNTTVIAANTVARAFDIVYEQASGRAMVVYAANSTGKVYYCIWDGTSWGPVSNCAPDTSGHTNELSLTDGTNTLSGSPRWIKLASYGTQLGDYRNNQLLLTVQDSNKGVYVNRWTGSAWTTTDRLVPTTSGGPAATDAPIDVGWESVSGLEMFIYANSTALTYRTSSGSGWSSATTIQTLGTAASWVRMASDSKSNRMSMIVGFSTSLTIRGYIWKTDGTTAGWTAWTTDITAETNSAINQNLDTAWEKANSGTPKALFVTSANNARVTTYRSWTQAGGFTAAATTTGNSTDDADNVILAASPNTDDIMMVRGDVDCDLKMQAFDGTSWKTMVTTTITTTLSSNTGTTSCVSNTDHGQQPFAYAHNAYSAWSQNWRVYDDETTAGNPGVALAAQDTQATVKPNNSVRLRMAIAELSGGSNSGNRKKLQYSSGAGCPDSTSCSWTDVGAQGSGSIWRYANGGATDDAAVASTTLTGATDLGRVYENGTSSSTDAPAAGSIAEYDYTLQNNGATIGTVYYLRAYDYGASVSGGASTNLNAIYRQQKGNTSGSELSSCYDDTTSVACTYPTLYSYTSAPHPPVFSSPPGGTTTPLIQLSSSDDENDYIQYAIEYCPTNSWPCASGGGIVCQYNVAVPPTCTGSQTNWTGQDANGSTAYIGSSVLAGSTIASYQFNAGIFSPNTTYYLRAKATDPGGSATESLYSSTVSFTTAAVDILIRGGTCINRDAAGNLCGPTIGTNVTDIKIGN